jgi:hypothetical protein
MVRKKPSQASELAEIFARGGYVRLQNPQRLREGPQSYRKGEEVRLVAQSMTELRTIRRLLRAAGFSPGRPFLKHSKWCQPLYGVEAVGRFLTIIEEGTKKKR